MNDNQKKVIVIEDEALIAAEIKSTLQLLGYNVVGHSMDGDKALDIFASTPADLILLDINIQGSLSGIDLAKIIRKKYEVPFIFLTSYSDKNTLDSVKDLMPYGYIVKPFTENDISVNIELALHKHHLEKQSKSFSQDLIEQRLNVKFTQREFALLEAFKDGLTYKEAGEKLFISINTIKTYQKRLFQLLEVSSKHELMEKIR